MKTLYEYDLYYPTTNASGERSAERTLDHLKERLTEFFGGLTDFRHRSDGTWKFGGVTYHDEVILLRMLAEDSASARACLAEMKRDLEDALKEEQILIIEREVRSM
jgi:hypothetical protein